jgi:hypothetical protein
MLTRAGLLAFGILFCLLPSAWADEELAIRSTWQVPRAGDVKAQVEAWVVGQMLNEGARDRIAGLWSGQIDGSDLLERAVKSFAAANAGAAQVVELCTRPTAPLILPQLPILREERQPPLVRHSLRLFLARWLIEHELYDEALGQLAGLTPQNVIDPAALLFQQAVLAHRFRDKQGLAAATALLRENERELPRRYVAVARLLEADLHPLQPDSLDEIARLMDEVGRQLDRGRAGTKVRRTEDEVVRKLEKLIEELEDPPTPRVPGTPGGKPTQPKEEPIAGGPRGPDEVDPKDIGRKDGWGNLPPKDRQAVLQELSKDLPAHYREVIEQYFRKLARDQKN